MTHAQSWDAGAACAALSYGGVGPVIDTLTPAMERMSRQKTDGWLVAAFLAGFEAVNRRAVIWLGKYSRFSTAPE